MLNDWRYALRMLSRNAGFTVIVVLTLGLGIGANTTLFSIVNGVLLNPLPYADPEQLVAIHQSKPNFNAGAVPYPNFLDLQKENRTFSAMALSRPFDFTLFNAGEPERVQAQLVTADFFSLLGVRPVLGRTFVKGEDARGAEPRVLISEGLWRRKFASVDVIGQSLILDDGSYTITGVIPSSFSLTVSLFQPADVYVPIGQWKNPALENRGAALALHGIGRLKPGVPVTEGQADLKRVMRNLAISYPATNTDNSAVIIPLKERITGRVGSILWLLLGAVGFVLLIACVNVSNLLLARSTSRTREFAIRAALGAGRRVLLLQSLTESTLLALGGGLLGLLLAGWGTSAALSILPAALPRAEEVGMDWRVVLFTFTISVITGILSGLAPALRTSQWRLSDTLKEGERGTSGPRMRTQSIFVAVQMALAVVLFIGAGLMIRTMTALWKVDPGFRSEGVLTFGMNLPPSSDTTPPETIRANLLDLQRRIGAVPGVQAVSFSTGSSPLRNSDDNVFRLEGEPEPTIPAEMKLAVIYLVDPGYLQTMGIQLKQGRFFTEQDDERSQPVIVIDEVLARKYYPNSDPIGKRIYYDETLRQIIGVVGHVKQYGLEADDSSTVRAQIYTAFRQLEDDDLPGLSSIDVSVRTKTSPMAAFESIRQAVVSQNNQNVIYQPQTMNEVIAASLGSRRFTMTLMGAFAAVALLLASLGIYGVISYLVGQRTHEFGIRIALGARNIDVLNLVLHHGMKMALAGVFIGLLSALAFTRFIATMLYGASPTDPATFVSIGLFFTIVALIACFLPARRATKVNPLTALRWE